MNVVIVEDEKLAAKRLEQLLNKTHPELEVIAKLSTVKRTIDWFKNNSSPDLLFLDIQLSDGLSFEIFEHITIDCPIIFTTAYDEYALQAFKVNSIDYLLKPVDEEDIEVAINKLNQLQKIGNNTKSASIDQLANAIEMLTGKYKKRFVVKTGEHIRTILTGDIEFFFSRNKATYCHTKEGKNYLLDYTLEQLEPLIDPESYFRINRQYIISHASIADIIAYSNSRLKIKFQDTGHEEVIVSRERVNDFKKWLES